MNPYIYEDTSDLLYGLSQYSLIDVISCIVTEERNGRFDLELQYPLNGVNSDIIVPNAIIMSEPRPTANPEPFRICEIEQTIEGVMLVKANHIAYDLIGSSYYAGFYRTGIANAIAMQSSFTNNSWWTLTTDLTDTTTKIGVDNPITMWEYLGRLVSLFGGELKYSWDHNNNKLKVELLSARGVQKSTTIQYGSNIIALDRVRNTNNSYSTVTAWWWDGSSIASIVTGSVSTGITDPVRELLVDAKSAFPAAPTVADLQAVAQAYIDANGLSDGVHDELTVDYVPLEITTEGASSERLDLCDTATVDASLIGVTATAKCIETVYNPLTGKYDSVKVGILQKTIIDTIASIPEAPTASSNWKPSTGAVTIVEPTSSSLANASWVTKANVTLPAGTYMIEYGCAFSANNTGIRRCGLSPTQNSDAAFVRGAGDSKNAVQGTLTYTSGTAIITLSTQRTLYMNARQDSGSSLTVYPWIRAVRIN
jgi:phage minor structural protein